MIDEEWLAGVRFTSLGGVRVAGLVGTGTEKVVLRGTTPDGREVALSTRRHLLGYHIREVPPQILADPAYDAQVLNRKLSQLMELPGVDEMISGWDRLFSLLIKLILTHGFDVVNLLPLADRSAMLLTDLFPVLTYSSPVRRRLMELSRLGTASDPVEFIVTVNGPSFPITDLRPTLVEKATKALQQLDGGPPEAADLESNPLFIWGGAAMEGFFDARREAAAAIFIEQRYGRLTSSPAVLRLITEADALANVFAYFFDSDDDRAAVTRFTSLCARCGLVFEVLGRDGRVVADGMRFAAGDQPPEG